MTSKYHRILFLFIFILQASPMQAETLRVAVAANFASTLKKIKLVFEKKYPHRMQIISASSGKLFAQIQYGAPYDVFMSADAKRPLQLEKLGLIVNGSRQTYAFGQLALWSPHNEQPFDYLKSLRFKRLAIANPKTAPYGVAAVETLRKLKLFNQTKSKQVRGENINQSYQFARSGNADIAFVSLSQLIHQEDNFQAVSSEYYTPITQQLIIVKSSPKKELANLFVRFLNSEKINKLIQNNGYRLP